MVTFRVLTPLMWMLFGPWAPNALVRESAVMSSGMFCNNKQGIVTLLIND